MGVIAKAKDLNSALRYGDKHYVTHSSIIGWLILMACQPV